MSKRRAEGVSRVKGGGRLTAAGFLFELSGGALCLDFVNTVDDRPTAEPKELLRGYADLVAWARQAGAVTATQARALERDAGRRSGDAEEVLGRARRLRETLHEIFAGAAGGRRVDQRGLRALGPALAEALGHLRLSAVADGGVRWTWEDDPEALDRMLWPVLRSASELLTSDDLARVRECASERCGWLFIDRSRNRSRRWCDMTVCGNRDKVRRHRARQRGRRGLSSGPGAPGRERRTRPRSCRSGRPPARGGAG